MKKSLLFCCLLISLISCKKDDAQPATPNSNNTLTFETTYTNVAMTGAASGSKWQLNAVINLPTVGGFEKKLAFNLKFLQRPTSNGSYTIVTTEPEVLATTAMLYINYVDYNPSPTDNTSTSYFLKSGTTGAITVSMVSNKVSIQFAGLTLTGNRGGGDKANVAANMTEQ